MFADQHPSAVRGLFATIVSLSREFALGSQSEPRLNDVLAKPTDEVTLAPRYGALAHLQKGRVKVQDTMVGIVIVATGMISMLVPCAMHYHFDQRPSDEIVLASTCFMLAQSALTCLVCGWSSLPIFLRCIVFSWTATAVLLFQWACAPGQDMARMHGLSEFLQVFIPLLMISQLLTFAARKFRIRMSPIHTPAMQWTIIDAIPSVGYLLVAFATQAVVLSGQSNGASVSGMAFAVSGFPGVLMQTFCAVILLTPIVFVFGWSATRPIGLAASIGIALAGGFIAGTLVADPTSMNERLTATVTPLLAFAWLYCMLRLLQRFGWETHFVHASDQPHPSAPSMEYRSDGFFDD